MDAATAGVIGTAVGGGLALLGSITTGFFGARQTRAQLASQEKEAARQRRYESLVERRTTRAKVFEDFMREAQGFTEAISGTIATAKRTNYPHQVVPSSSPVTALTRANTSVAIQGPETVAVAADAVLMLLVQLAQMTFTPGPGGNEPRVMELFSRLSQFLSQFTEAALEALEDHGGEPSAEG
ncbi:hypothetical protein [Streptomyces sp. NBC_01190]|uniref:hypothetical protein n=1 Tax=Streptomyces sp. NBC_01190 TaxID=2903767 RepID=UPI00386DD3D0|nr:hypothetical protein OG519_07390 [Streptomyces sp. NBC_01190]